MPRLGKLDHEDDVCILTVCLVLLLVTAAFQADFLKFHKLTDHFLLCVE